MPFHKRIVEPQRLCRLNCQQFISRTEQAYLHSDFSLLSSLNDVSGKNLSTILQQLSDLSRHACSIFLELQKEAASVFSRSADLQKRLDNVQNTVKKIDHKKLAIPVSSLDEECKWSVHYTAPWHQQDNVLLPGSRPPCVEELHHQAKVNLKTALKKCDKVRKDGFCSSQCSSEGPMFSSPVCTDGLQDQEKKYKSSECSDEEDKLVYSMGLQTPLLESIYDINIHSNWTKSSPLPTPEEKMRQQALSVATDIVPINITGENFDRQASFRRTLINTDTVIRRSKRVKRRKTITGVPDNIQKELASKEQTGIRSQSMYMPDQYSTLGRAGSVNLTLKKSLTCDSGCQTEDIKIVPPSMRRIRAQKGHGIAVQLANISLSSSGSMTNMSECNGAVYTSQPNNSDQGFHSLPRQGVRNTAQQLESSNHPYQIGSTSSLPCKFNMHHASPESQHMPDSEKLTSISPTSKDFQGFQVEHHKETGYRVSNHNSPPFLDNGATQQKSRNFAHSTQTCNKIENVLQPMPPCPSEQLFSSTVSSFSAGFCSCQSPVSLHVITNTGSQCSTLDERICNRHKSDISDSCSTLTTDHWRCKPTSKDQHVSSGSSPVSHNYHSLESSLKKSDSSSLFSLDTSGCYTSMILDSGLKSYSHGCISKVGKARHMYTCREHYSQDDRASLNSSHSLSRSISLRKAKKPPLPPRRTDSLQNKSLHITHHNEYDNEYLITNFHKSTKSHESLPFSEFEDPWVLRSRSHSTVSATSSGTSAAMSPITLTHSDSSSQHSEYAELCDGHIECLHLCSEQGTPISISKDNQAEENSREIKSNPSNDCNRPETNSKMAVSPDVVHILSSPSSGYSSQSITPTMGTPVLSLLRARSPAGRPKPKVPERKSSLASKISSSCTPLPSSNHIFIENFPPPPPIPKTLPGLLILQSAPIRPTSSSVITPKADLTTPSQSSTVSSTSEIKQNIPELSPTSEDSKSSNSLSPEIFSGSSAVSDLLSLTENKISPQKLPSPSTLSLVLPTFHTQSSFHVPEMHLQSVTMLQPSDLQIDKTRESKKEANFSHHEEPEKHMTPLITPQALQMIQFRPIKLMKLENIFTNIFTPVCDRKEKEQDLDHRPSSDKSVKTETLNNCDTFDTASPLENEINTLESPVKAFTHNILSSDLPNVLQEPISNTESCENVQEFTIDNEALDTSSAGLDILQSRTSPVGMPLNENSLLSTKKPKLSLIMPPTCNQPALSGLEPFEVTGSSASSEPEALKDSSLLDSVDLQEVLLQLELEQLQLELEDDSLSYPMGPSGDSFSREISSDSIIDPALTFNEHETGLSDEDLGQTDKDLNDKSISGSNSCRSLMFEEEENNENDAVLDSSPESSSSSTNGDTIEENVTPAHLRTTEDLFAVIHRSKRKVLGRCESEEERFRGFFPSPPIIPPSSCLVMPSMPHQTSFIQRGLRRSSTSSNSFKALLLKKGSRSDPGFRMSASEMLKCSDPRLQRENAKALPSWPSPCVSPGRNRKASGDWARKEGVVPHFLPSLTPSKYGRASTPPSAASSRYNSRSRIPSGPMTVICEKEGEHSELSESSDCFFSTDIPLPVSMTANGMVFVQGSTSIKSFPTPGIFFTSTNN